MKTLPLLALLLTFCAYAQTEFDVENTVTTQLLYVGNIVCVTPIRKQEAIYTQLDHNFKGELKHRAPRAIGCDLEALEKLVSDSHQRFGHALAQVTLSKYTANSPIRYQGTCKRFYQEEFTIDFGNDVILKTPVITRLKPDTSCL